MSSSAKTKLESFDKLSSMRNKGTRPVEIESVPEIRYNSSKKRGILTLKALRALSNGFRLLSGSENGR